MGLHVNIDKIHDENVVKHVFLLLYYNKYLQGIRKQGFLVNQLGKLAKEDRKALIEINREKYGISDEDLKKIQLPNAVHLVEIYQIEKIINSKSKLSIVEKLNHLLKL